MSGHRFSPDHQTLFFSERAGQNTVEIAVSSGRADQALHDRAVPRRRHLREPRIDHDGARRRRRRGAARARPQAGAAARPAPAAASSCSRPTAAASTCRAPPTTRTRSRSGRRRSSTRWRSRPARRQRLYESANAGVFERVTTPIDLDAGRYIVAKEGPTEITQYYLVDGSTRTPLTTNEDVTPDLTRAPKEQFIVERPDGFKFRVNVTLPPDYQKGTRLPAIFWFYPREFADAGRVRPRHPHVQQERGAELRHALDGLLHPPGLRRRRARRADRRPDRADERQLRARPAQQPRGRRSTSSTGGRSSTGTGSPSAATATARSPP